MVFLIVYDRHKHELMQPVEEFASRPEARKRRLEVLLGLPPEIGHHEVVLLEADDLDTVKLTHARYFYSTAELARAGAAEAAEAIERLRKSRR